MHTNLKEIDYPQTCQKKYKVCQDIVKMKHLNVNINNYFYHKFYLDVLFDYAF